MLTVPLVVFSKINPSWSKSVAYTQASMVTFWTSKLLLAGMRIKSLEPLNDLALSLIPFVVVVPVGVPLFVIVTGELLVG